MHLYVEAWKARPAWLALPPAERERFMATVGQAIGNQLAAGCELVGVTVNDAAVPRGADYPYMAVWKMEPDHVPAFEDTWERVGWHTYFEQVNLRGALVDPDTFAAHQVGLPAPTAAP